jgi:hypothetical protein
MGKIRERLAVNKQGFLKLYTALFNLKKLNEVEGKVKYHAEVSNRFAALENLDALTEIHSAWDMIRENINISEEQV